MATKKPPSRIAARINAGRIKRGWSYRDFAKKLDAPVGSVHLWCNGDSKSEPHVNTLRRIADVFGCEISDLTDGTTATAKAS